MGGKVFKRKLAHSVAVEIVALKHIKNFIASVQKCKAHLKTNFKCVCITTYMYVFLSDESVLM